MADPDQSGNVPPFREPVYQGPTVGWVLEYGGPPVSPIQGKFTIFDLNSTPSYPEGEVPITFEVFSGDPVFAITNPNPTAGISRREAIHAETTGGQNAALYISSIGNNVSDNLINSQVNGLTSKATQIGSGDVCAGYFVGTQSGTAYRGLPGVAYGIFADAETTVSGGSGIALETITINTGGPDHSQGSFAPHTIGVNLQAAGAFRCGMAIAIGGVAGGIWDGGIYFAGIRTSMIFAATDSIDIIRGQAAHTDGINLLNATFSGNAYSSPGFAIDGSGTGSFDGATPIPAGGTAGKGIKLSTTTNFGVFFGSNPPTLTAAKGSLYLRSNGSGVNDRIYVNTDGANTWTALVTVA